MKAHLKSTFCPECRFPAGKWRVASSHWKEVKRTIEKFIRVMATPMSTLNEKTAVELTSLLCYVFNRSNKKSPHVAQLTAIAIPKWNPRPRNAPFLELPGTLVTPPDGCHMEWKMNGQRLVFISFPEEKRTFCENVMTWTENRCLWTTCRPSFDMKMTSMKHESTRKSKFERVGRQRRSSEAKKA